MLLNGIPLVIGYSLEKALELLGEGHSITVNSTTTPYEDKKAERQGNRPIVVRQKTIADRIELTTSLFK